MPLKNSLTTIIFFSSINTMATPKSKAKNIICNILPLSLAALKKLDGTMSIRNCRGIFPVVQFPMLQGTYPLA